MFTPPASRVQNGGGCALTKKPALRTVVDAAQFKTAIAPGGLITIYGTDFQTAGNKRAVGPGDIRNNQFPQILGCIGVQVNGQAIPITYAQFDQINAQLPAGVPTGSAQVRVIANPGSPNEFDGDTGTVTIQNYAPAFFTFNGSSVAALSTTYVPVADPSVVSTGHPAKPGDVVLLYATGLGPTSPSFRGRRDTRSFDDRAITRWNGVLHHYRRHYARPFRRLLRGSDPRLHQRSLSN